MSNKLSFGDATSHRVFIRVAPRHSLLLVGAVDCWSRYFALYFIHTFRFRQRSILNMFRGKAIRVINLVFLGA